MAQDFAYCLLDEAVTSVPIIPVASACEQSAILPGNRLIQVGFGFDENVESGRKKMLDVEINAIEQGEILAGFGDDVICAGDSGGPSFVYLDTTQGGDDTWRVAAIQSWGLFTDPTVPTCIPPSYSGIITNDVTGWIEQETGLDITPCGNADAWDPTIHCGGLATEPWLGEEDYGATGCTSTVTVEYTGICGPPFDDADDAVPPVVEIVSPQWEQNITPEGDSAPVEIVVEATDQGWGVASVELTIRDLTSGSEQVEVRDEWTPWMWPANLVAGSYEVEAVATDHAGNVSDVAFVCFGVDESGCEGVGLDTGSGSSTAGESGELPEGTTGTTADTDDVGGASDGGDSGCGCRADESYSDPLLGVLALLLVGAGPSRRGGRRYPMLR